jgi:hypothetical protein
MYRLEYYGNKLRLTLLPPNATIKIEKLLSCEDDSQRELVLLTSLNGVFEFEYTLEDGRYLITVSYLDSSGINVILEGRTINIMECVLQSLIDDMELILIGCGCPTCEDCKDFTHKDMRDLVSKLISYLLSKGTYYDRAKKYVKEAFPCVFEDLNYCLLLNESIYGNNENVLTFKTIIAYYYNVLIEGEILNGAFNDLDYIRERFNYKKIKRGVNSLGMKYEFVYYDEHSVPSFNSSFIYTPVFVDVSLYPDLKEQRLLEVADAVGRKWRFYYNYEFEIYSFKEDYKEKILFEASAVKMGITSVIQNTVFWKGRTNHSFLYTAQHNINKFAVKKQSANVTRYSFDFIIASDEGSSAVTPPFDVCTPIYKNLVLPFQIYYHVIVDLKGYLEVKL